MSDAYSQITGWASDPRPDAGLHILAADGRWVDQAYPRLAELTLECSDQIQRAGAGAGDSVVICEPEPSDFLIALYGVWLAGATAVPIAPRPAAGTTIEESVRRARNETDAVLCVGSGLPGAVTAVSPRCESSSSPGNPHVALVQFTSGSSGSPAAVEVTFENLAAHLRAAIQKVPWTEDLAISSWLPLHHDMGLVGLAMAAISSRVPLWQMRPEQFLVDPSLWLGCLGDGRANMTAAPPFAYGLAARRCSDTQARSWNFSGVRAAIVGAERLTDRPLISFLKRFAPHNFQPHMLRPAYGLAEATLTVAGHPAGAPARILSATWSSMRLSEVLPGAELKPLSGDTASERPGLVGSGTPLAEVNLTITDEDGASLPDGHVGEITVAGPTVARRSDGRRTSTSSDGHAVLATGDMGLILEGELFVLGRFGDSIKVRGETINSETIEAVAASACGVAVPRCVALALSGGDGDAVEILIEGEISDERRANAEAAARALLGRGVAITVRSVDHGSILRTTSGKPRRRAMRESLTPGATRERTSLPVQL